MTHHKFCIATWSLSVEFRLAGFTWRTPVFPGHNQIFRNDSGKLILDTMHKHRTWNCSSTKASCSPWTSVDESWRCILRWQSPVANLSSPQAARSGWIRDVQILGIANTNQILVLTFWHDLRTQYAITFQQSIQFLRGSSLQQPDTQQHNCCQPRNMWKSENQTFWTGTDDYSSSRLPELHMVMWWNPLLQATPHMPAWTCALVQCRKPTLKWAVWFRILISGLFPG